MSWFGRRRAAAEAVDARETAPAGRYPRMARNAPVDVSRVSGELLCRGRLARFSAWELRVERLPGELSLPVLEPGDVVHVHGAAADDVEPFVLEAVVVESTRLCLRVDNLALVDDAGRRASARRGVWRPAELFDLDNPRLRETPVPCEVVNVSMTGACVRTAAEYREGRRLRLRLELYDRAGVISFVSEVVRASAAPGGGFEYGLLFEELTREKRRYLEDDLREMAARAERRASS